MQNNGNMIRIATAILAAAFFAACKSVSESPLVLDCDLWVVPNAADSSSMLKGESLREGSLSIEFLNDGQVQGFTCCNSYFGSYTTNKNDSVCRINITIEGMTLALCPHGDLEREYIEKLKEVRSYAVRHKQLLLMDSTGEVTLRFIPASMTQKKH